MACISWILPHICLALVGFPPTYGLHSLDSPHIWLHLLDSPHIWPACISWIPPTYGLHSLDSSVIFYSTWSAPKHKTEISIFAWSLASPRI
ncbi:unnamed protein product, partial [Staurois parvus]